VAGIGTEQPLTEKADRYWEQYLKSLPSDAAHPESYVEAFSFGFSPGDATEIANLVLQGTKTATGSVLWEYEFDNQPVPRVGDHWVVEDGKGEPVCIIKTSEVSVIPFDEVGETYAVEGGEGDCTLEGWRSIYWHCIVAACERIGREPSKKAPLVMERFAVVYSEALRREQRRSS
jgi:uncharacterized protein YhfF